jgi:hypothetical protein
MDQLFLRFQTSLVQGYWGKSKVTSEQVNKPQDTDSSRIIDVGLSFTPAIQLRLEI